MENLRLLIIEDEVLIAEDLKDSVLSFGVKHIDMAHTEQIALEKIAKFKPDIVLLDIRLPRVVLAILVGSALSTSGAVYQTVFRNPLADPYLLGAAAGAGLGATIAITNSAVSGFLPIF